jgi:hypothetical protein
MATIERFYNDRPVDYDRDMLETAWLTLADSPTDRVENPRTLAVRRLVRDGWQPGVAIEYVVVASNWDGKG